MPPITDGSLTANSEPVDSKSAAGFSHSKQIFLASTYLVLHMCIYIWKGVEQSSLERSIAHEEKKSVSKPPTKLESLKRSWEGYAVRFGGEI